MSDIGNMAENSRFLIVDSKTTRRHSLQNILLTLGYRQNSLVSAATKENVTECLNQETFTCVFIYSGDPNLDWLDLISYIRTKYDYNQLPIVILSVQPTREGVVSSYEAGANGVLSFPCSANDVESVLSLIKK